MKKLEEHVDMSDTSKLTEERDRARGEVMNLQGKLDEAENKIKNALKIIDEAPFDGTFIVLLNKALKGIGG